MQPNKLAPAAERLRAWLDDGFTYKAWRGAAPEGEPTLKRDVDAVLSALQPAPAVEGYVLVPVEPTEAMIGEGDRVMYGRYGCSFEVSPIYDAMLSAAPPPPQDGGERLREALKAMLKEHDTLSGNYGDVMDPKHVSPDRWPNTAAMARAALRDGGERG